MKETFEEYLQRLKDRRTEDNYNYTDEDFKNHIHYIFDCHEKDLSVYKCLEFMYFAEREIQPEQIWNEEKMEGVKKLIQKHKLIEIIKSDEELGLYEAFKNIPEPNDKLKKAFRDFGKKETLEEAASKWVFETNGHKWSNNNDEAGDNFGSFIAGFNEAERRLYNEEDMRKAIQETITLMRYKATEFREHENTIIEKFKKK